MLVSVLKAADLNSLVQGGQPYWSFHFSKDSLEQVITEIKIREKFDFLKSVN